MINAPLFRILLHPHISCQRFGSGQLTYLSFKLENLFAFLCIQPQQTVNGIQLIAREPLTSLDIRDAVTQLFIHLAFFPFFVIRLKQPLDHMRHLILVLIIDHQHVVIVASRLKSLEMLFLVVD